MIDIDLAIQNKFKLLVNKFRERNPEKKVEEL